MAKCGAGGGSGGACGLDAVAISIKLDGWGPRSSVHKSNLESFTSLLHVKSLPTLSIPGTIRNLNPSEVALLYVAPVYLHGCIQ